MYIVTDLTRFAAGNPRVCTALINIDTGSCVRPMPYLTYEYMQRNNVIPGVLFDGNFVPSAGRVTPHFEDCSYSALVLNGPASRDAFRLVLSNDSCSSVRAGFNYRFGVDQKVVPTGTMLAKSIITLRVAPNAVEILPDQYTENKIKISFTDGAGQTFRYLPITDLGFFDYASGHRDAQSLRTINRHIRQSDEVFLRVGLSRHYQQGARNGYWLQVNGIYTFPSRLEVVRGYSR